MTTFCSPKASLISYTPLSSSSMLGMIDKLTLLKRGTVELRWRRWTLLTLWRVKSRLSRGSLLTESERGYGLSRRMLLAGRGAVILDILRRVDALDMLSLLSLMYSHRYSFFSLNSRSSSSNRPYSDSILFSFLSSAYLTSFLSR